MTSIARRNAPTAARRPEPVGAALRPAGAALLALVLAAQPAAAQADEPAGPTSDTAEAPRPDPGVHALLDDLLRRFVDDGVVDYTGLAEERDALRRYLARLGDVDPTSLDRPARTAYWINAYNAFTLELILDHLGDIDGIKDIPSGRRWKAERWDVSGETYSLDEIEHEILRPMGDARVHFALVCASVSCPDLRAEAYLPETLDEQLDDAARRFLADTSKGLDVRMESGWFGGDDPTLYLSSIFDWFEEDFERDADDVVSFVRRYAPEEAVAFIDRHRDDLDVDHLDYDWSLNGR